MEEAVHSGNSAFILGQYRLQQQQQQQHRSASIKAERRKRPQRVLEQGTAATVDKHQDEPETLCRGRPLMSCEEDRVTSLNAPGQTVKRSETSSWTNERLKVRRTKST